MPVFHEEAIKREARSDIDEGVSFMGRQACIGLSAEEQEMVRDKKIFLKAMSWRGAKKYRALRCGLEGTRGKTNRAGGLDSSKANQQGQGFPTSYRLISP